jgi:hypothetical protein
MGRTAARTIALDITRPRGPMRGVLRLRQPMGRRRLGRRITLPLELTGLRIRGRTRTQAGAVRRLQRMARRWIRSTTRMRMGRWGRQRAQTEISMRPRTATPTRTPGAVGRMQAGRTRMLHMAGEEVAEARLRNHTAAGVRQRSAAGAATRMAPVVDGVHAPRVHAAGAAVVVEVDGVEGAVVVVLAADGRACVQGREHEKLHPFGGSECFI